MWSSKTPLPSSLFPRPSLLFAQLFDLNLTQAKILWQVWFQEATDFQSPSIVDISETQDHGLSIKELATILQLEVTTVQKEVKELVNQGLLTREKVGRKFRYRSGEESIVQAYVTQYLEAAQTFLQQLEVFTVHSPAQALQGFVKQFQPFIQGWETVGPGIPKFTVQLPYTTTESEVEELSADITGKLTMVPDVIHFKGRSMITTMDPAQSPSTLESNLVDVLIPQLSERRVISSE